MWGAGEEDNGGRGGWGGESANEFRDLVQECESDENPRREKREK